MLASVAARYFPRSEQESALRRRSAALQAAMKQLGDRVDDLQREQQTQFQRIAQIQADLDEIKRLLKRSRAKE
jgi:hypothetical protein